MRRSGFGGGGGAVRVERLGREAARDQAEAERPTEPATADAPESAPSKMAQYDETFVTLEPGQIVRGKGSPGRQPTK